MVICWSQPNSKAFMYSVANIMPSWHFACGSATLMCFFVTFFLSFVESSTLTSPMNKTTPRATPDASGEHYPRLFVVKVPNPFC